MDHKNSWVVAQEEEKMETTKTTSKATRKREIIEKYCSNKIDLNTITLLSYYCQLLSTEVLLKTRRKEKDNDETGVMLAGVAGSSWLCCW